jgi:hypothetical protein
MAMSSGLPVTLTVPCVNCCATVATSTPMPSVRPLAAIVEAATISENSARATLAPMVLALAMLLPITSRLRLAALRPESPVWNDMVLFLG